MKIDLKAFDWKAEIESPALQWSQEAMVILRARAAYAAECQMQVVEP